MTDNWISLNTPNLVPEPIKAIGSAIGSLTDLSTSLLEGIRTALEIAKALTATPIGNPIEAALQAAIAELEAFLDGLVKETATHAIFIPIQKQPFGRGKRPLHALPDERLTSFDDLLESGAFSGWNLDSLPMETIDFINTAETAVGGNAGFWKCFSQSLIDRGDNNRPLFPDTFAVTGVCLLFGADTLSALQGNFDLFSTFFKLSPKADLSFHTRPVISNVSSRALLISEGSPSRIGVQLNWSNVSPILNFPLFSDETLITKEIFVIRTTDITFRTKATWSDIFSRQPQNSITDLQSEGHVKVIARIPNDGMIVRYIDTDPVLEGDIVYYYAAALRYEMGGVIQPMSNLSNITRVQLTRPHESKGGEYPDWVASPSLVQLFPIIEEILDQAKLAVASVQKRSISHTGILNNMTLTIAQIERLVAQAEELNTKIADTTNRMNAILNQELSAGIYSTTVTVSTGGIAGWGAELARRLSDPSDSSRPPFDTEDALVAGFIALGGAPTLLLLEPIIAMQELFFGSSEKNIIVDAIDTLDSAIRENESIVFDAGMNASRTTA